MQLDVDDAGIADHLYLQQAVFASHLCSADTGVTQLRLHRNPNPNPNPPEADHQLIITECNAKTMRVSFP